MPHAPGSSDVQISAPALRLLRTERETNLALKVDPSNSIPPANMAHELRSGTDDTVLTAGQVAALTIAMKWPCVAETAPTPTAALPRFGCFGDVGSPGPRVVRSGGRLHPDVDRAPDPRMSWHFYVTRLAQSVLRHQKNDDFRLPYHFVFVISKPGKFAVLVVAH